MDFDALRDLLDPSLRGGAGRFDMMDRYGPVKKLFQLIKGKVKKGA